MDSEMINDLIRDSIPSYFEATEQEVENLVNLIIKRCSTLNINTIKHIDLDNYKRNEKLGLICDINISFYEPIVIHYFDEESKRLKPYAIHK